MGKYGLKPGLYRVILLNGINAVPNYFGCWLLKYYELPKRPGLVSRNLIKRHKCHS